VDINLADVSFRNATLHNAYFSAVVFQNIDLTGADARGAQGLDATGAPNFINPEGAAENGINIGFGETMLIRNYHAPEYGNAIPITVQQSISLVDSAILQLEFDGDVWNSTMVLDEGAIVGLDGTLVLALASGVTGADIGWGTTFQLFDWSNAISVEGEFSLITLLGDYGSYSWDTSNLYTDGTITLIPESSAWVLLIPGAAMLRFRSRRKKA